MADRGKYVDIFFRNGLREFEVLPPPGVWGNIQPSLIKREKYLSILRLAAALAIVVSLSGFAFWLSNGLLKDLNGPAISLNQENLPVGLYQERLETASSQLISPIAENPGIAKTAAIAKVAQPEVILPNISNPGLFTQNMGEIEIRKGSTQFNKTNKLDLNSQPSGIENLNPAAGITESSKGENAVNRWTISAMASPNYFSGTAIGLNQSFSNSGNSEKPAVSYSGGLGLSLTINKRISIQSGIYYSSLGQEIVDVSSYAGFGRYYQSKGGSNFGVRTSGGMIVSTNGDIFLRDKISTRVSTKYALDYFDPVKANLTYLSNSIIQNFSYLEVPVMVKYKAIDRKMDVNFIGGISYNMLVGNSAFSYVNGEKFVIGKTDNMNPTNFSSSFGLGLEYFLWEKISLNIEPTFRYYLLPLGETTGTSSHPYSFGFFSGLSYKF
jgi:hypothetical protein